MILPQDPVQAAIVHSLNNHSYDDAIFLSERLFAEAPTDSTLFLLATCYYQSGSKSQTYRFLRSKGYPTARCKYLFSKCCFEIGKLDEVENILTNGKTQLCKGGKEFVDEYGDNASFAISLLADVYRKTDRHEKALDYYKLSLVLNPFMWSSFCHICRLGGKPEPEVIFKANQVQNAMESVRSVMFSPQTFNTVLDTRVPIPCADGSSTPLHMLNTSKLPLMTTPGDNLASFNDSDCLSVPPPVSFRSTPTNLTMETVPGPSPSFGTLPLDTPLPGSLADLGTPAMSSLVGFSDLPPAPTKKLSKPAVTSTIMNKLVFGQSSTSNTKPEDTVPPLSRPSYLIAPRRRSKRILDSQNSSNVKENSKVQTRVKHTSPRSGTRRAKSGLKLPDDITTKNRYNSCVQRTATASASDSLDRKQKQSASAFLSLLKDLGTAYLASQSFDVKKAVEVFESVPHQQYKTGWVLAEVGKAYLELSEYQKAEEIFKELRVLEPHQIRGMETYSTVLFHLQKEVALSTLAQDMVEIDKSCAQTWCVNGNCFSLQKEHETAIKFLQRAIQADPNFTYAYTLLGHEYTLTEDYDKAMSAFRNALRVDTRHYNAWYGLGMIYYKKEKFSLAETHFKKALIINPQSAVLLCHIGLVQHALQKHHMALETLTQAVELSPRNPMCLFHRASMLVANDKLEQALEELESLKALTPKESLVYFLIGKVHKKLGNAHLSMLNFSWATDLDPKGANNHIKEAIDRRYVTDDDDELSLDNSILLLDTPSEALSTETSMMDSDEGQPQLHANESDDSL